MKAKILLKKGLPHRDVTLTNLGHVSWLGTNVPGLHNVAIFHVSCNYDVTCVFVFSFKSRWWKFSCLIWSSDICSSEFKSFAYLYNEDHFMAALVKDVNIVKTLPKNLKEARRKKAVPLYKVPNSASVYFYLHQVLPMLKKHSIVELVVSDGGCLQVMVDSSSLSFIFKHSLNIF